MSQSTKSSKWSLNHVLHCCLKKGPYSLLVMFFGHYTWRDFLWFRQWMIIYHCLFLSFPCTSPFVSQGVIQDVKLIFAPNGYITQCPNLNRSKYHDGHTLFLTCSKRIEGVRSITVIIKLGWNELYISWWWPLLADREEILPPSLVFFSPSTPVIVILLWFRCSAASSLPALFLHLFTVKQIKIQGHCCVTASATDQYGM